MEADCARNMASTLASRMLRHADIAITAQHYLDPKERTTIGMGNLLPMPENVTLMEDGTMSERSCPRLTSFPE